MKALFWILATSILALAHPEAAPKEDYPPSLIAFLEAVDKDAVINVAGASKVVADKLGKGFTGTLHSQSNQPGSRLLSFGEDAGMIVGFNQTDETLEIAVDTNSSKGIIPYQIVFGKQGADGKPYRVLTKPSDCVQCHGENFTYIFNPYRKWHKFLGEDDDQIDPNNEDFKRFKTASQFAHFFKDAKRDSFPYYANDDERTLNNMPNTRLTTAMNLRAASTVHHRIKETHPDRYEAVKHFIVAEYLCRDAKAGKAARRMFLDRMKKDMPEIFSRWQAIDSIPNETDKIVLMALHYLGVPPHEIILSEPLSGTLPLTSPTEFRAFWKKFPVDQEDLKYQEGGPLAYYDGQSMLGWQLIDLVQSDLDKKLQRSPKDYIPVEDTYGDEATAFEKSFRYVQGPYGLSKKKTLCRDLWKAASRKPRPAGPPPPPSGKRDEPHGEN